MPRPAPRVLISNDDGPPDAAHSMFLFGFVRALQTRFGWDVKVVVPSGQRSWAGKAYAIADVCNGEYYYPQLPDGLKGERSHERRPLRAQNGEALEMVLLNSTPATCTSIGLHNLHPGAIDLVITGPNVGRNSSTAFALSSGTIGAAMAAALSGVPAIALSYGIFARPPPENVVAAADAIACSIVEQLWEHGFVDTAEAELYSVNIPLVPEIASAASPAVQWTRMARTRYGRLFAPLDGSTPPPKVEQKAGPGVVQDTHTYPIAEQDEAAPKHSLRFRFKPDISGLLNPKIVEEDRGTDVHALHQSSISVTPLIAAFQEAAPADGVPLLPAQSPDLPRWKL